MTTKSKEEARELAEELLGGGAREATYDDAANKELQRRMMALQEARVRAERPLEQLLDDAMGLVALAGEPRFEGCPARICVYDQLIAIYSRIDEVGYAPDIEAIAERLLPGVGPESQCYECVEGSRLSALEDSGRIEEAERGELVRLTRLSTQTRDWRPLKRLGVLSTLVGLAIKRGDAEAARERLGRLEQEAGASFVRTWCMFDDSIDRWVRSTLASCRLQVAALGEADAALEAWGEAEVDFAPDGQDAARGTLRVAGALGREGSWLDALDFARDSAGRAQRSGHPRDEALAWLFVARAGRELGDDEVVGEARRGLAGALPRLKSRDLHARAAEAGLWAEG